MATVVLVDDSAIMRRGLRVILEEAGHSIVGEAGRGDELLALYERLRPDLVMLDIVLPGKDGVVAARELSGLHREARVIMCSSVTSREKIVACQRTGVAHHLLKPCEPGKVKTMVKFALALPGGARQPEPAPGPPTTGAASTWPRSPWTRCEPRRGAGRLGDVQVAQRQGQLPDHRAPQTALNRGRADQRRRRAQVAG